MKSAKIKRKGKHILHRETWIFMNHAAAHKHYSYEYWLRIWNPELFHIVNRDPSSSLLWYREQRKPDLEPEGGTRAREGRVALELFVAMDGLEVQQAVLGGGRSGSSTSCPLRTGALERGERQGSG